MADHPRPSIEKSTPPPAHTHAPAPAPAPATAQHSGHPDFPFRQLPPIVPAASAPSAAPTTTDNSYNFNLQVTSPSRRPQIQLPSIGSLGLLHDSGLPPPQHQQWPHQQETSRQPMPPSTPRYADAHLGYKLGSSHHEPDRPRSNGQELTPSHQKPTRRLSSSSAITASPNAPIYAKVDNVSQQQQVALPDPPSLLNGNQIHNVSIVPSTRRQQKEAYRKGSPIPQPRKRNRISVACIPCKKRKVKCDQAKPECGKCIGSKNPHGPCTYDPCVYDKKRPNTTRPLKFRSRPPPSRDPSPEQQPDSHMSDAFQNGEQRNLQPGPPHILNGSVSSYADSQSVSPRTYGGGSPSPRRRSHQIEAGDQPSPAVLENEALKRELSALRRQVQELSQGRTQQQQPLLVERGRSPTVRPVPSEWRV
ncbi:hypothetical protein B0T20DRAFT_167210 [Sordaria brevicollis]|uniref:Zn(2)-C6 fungal-type domain-containing protein n=1 Tax=Sordaria brevicollis TaxID=83679 RepID=A0AAE0UD44_SORBR|nr:hypothetical protein B0T20DRAFT_167210 [Sordaria brevicollis]